MSGVFELLKPQKRTVVHCNPKALELQMAKEKGFEPKQITVALDGLAVVVNPARYADILGEMDANQGQVADATLAMAQCYSLMEPKNLAEAARLYSSLEANPALRPRAGPGRRRAPSRGR